MSQTQTQTADGDSAQKTTDGRDTYVLGACEDMALTLSDGPTVVASVHQRGAHGATAAMRGVVDELAPDDDDGPRKAAWRDAHGRHVATLTFATRAERDAAVATHAARTAD